jgi:hypothetical protein
VPLSDWQCSIDAFVMGAGTAYRLGPDFLSGIRTTGVKGRDFELQGQDGSVGAGDYKDVRVIVADLVVVTDDLADLLAALDLLAAAWEPTAAEVAFAWKEPTIAERTVSGFPRRFEIDETDRRRLSGVQACTAVFHALNPAVT